MPENPVPSELKRHKRQLRRVDIWRRKGQSLYADSLWAERYPRDTDVKAIVSNHAKRISPEDISRLGTSKKQARKILIATLMWGYSVRVRWHNVDLALKDSKLERIAEQTMSLLKAGNLQDAYNAFTIKGIGQSFKSKFLYMLGLCCDSQPLPVVLDSRVEESMRALLERQKPSYLTSSQVLTHDSASYQNYVNLLNEWSKQLGCRPDSIELFLFCIADDPSGFLNNPSPSYCARQCGVCICGM